VVLDGGLANESGERLNKSVRASIPATLLDVRGPRLRDYMR